VDTAALAAQLLAECREREQSARTVTDDGDAAAVREEVRRLAAAAGLRIRTARMGSAVVVVRLDAAVWHEDTATMRRKLSPPDGA
jgi:hypothetical protein